MEGETINGFCQDILKRIDGRNLSHPIYVIQEHHAKSLHWDLRFEIDGTLKSWALPKTPPQKKGEKRLAVQVENHPLEYALFEGEIPGGNYGAGTVTIWDAGTFELLESRPNKMIVLIKGKKLEGRYCLLHFKPQEKNWLFFKLK
ncbi:MAG: 3'-phosphoesterase [Thaumarchaeota archaeon]|nr:3'-phosphoesterase [Nitrososphaerota archaeon]